MNHILATTFPVAGIWMYAFMTIVAIVLVPIFPFISRHRRRRAQRELHAKIEKAKAEILEDGVVEGPKGPYVPHKPEKIDMYAGHAPLKVIEAKPPQNKGFHTSLE